MQQVAVAWSGGKDSALALHRVQQRDDTTVDRLLTTVAAEHDRVTIHGVRRDVLEAQAAAIGVPVETVELPEQYTQSDHDAAMADALAQLAADGIDAVVYADIFLADVRHDREEMLADAGLDGVWPLWGEDTGELAETFIDAGFEAVTVCVDADRMDRSVAGRWYDERLLEDLPDGVDPCGENGAFHTLVTDGPLFEEPLAVAPDGVVTRATDGGRHHYTRLTDTGGQA